MDLGQGSSFPGPSEVAKIQVGSIPTVRGNMQFAISEHTALGWWVYNYTKNRYLRPPGFWDTTTGFSEGFNIGYWPSRREAWEALAKVNKAAADQLYQE